MSGGLGQSSLLLVDDDEDLLLSLRRFFEAEVAEIRCCRSVASTRALLRRWSPDILVLDVTLADGDAFSVLEELQSRSPNPLVVAISGTATPPVSFRLAHLGVSEYLEKPFTARELRLAIERALARPKDLGVHLRQLVGRRRLLDVEREVRATLVQEALARTSGSRRQAARLLGVSRQLLQYILRARKAR